DQRASKTEDAVGHAADIHQIAGQDEERNGEQRERRYGGIHPLRHRADHPRLAEPEEKTNGGEPHRHRDREAEQNQQDEDAEDQQNEHDRRCLCSTLFFQIPALGYFFCASSTYFWNLATLSEPAYLAISALAGPIAALNGFRSGVVTCIPLAFNWSIRPFSSPCSNCRVSLPAAAPSSRRIFCCSGVSFFHVSRFTT